MSFSNKIKELMLANGVNSGTQLANCIGIPQPTLNRLLTGKTKNPSQEIIRKIADFFDVSIDSLLNKENFLDIYIPESERHHNSPSSVLRYLMQDIGDLSEGELSRRTGVPQPTIHRILSGKTPNPRKDSIEPLAKFFGVSSDQMLALSPLSKDRVPGSYVTEATNYKTIPILNYEEISAWPEILRQPHFKNNRTWVSTDSQIDSLSFAFQLDHSNFAPEFKKDTLVIVDSQRKQQNGSYIVCSYQNQLLIGQITGEKSILSTTLNNFSEVSLKKCHIYGVIAETKKTYK